MLSDAKVLELCPELWQATASLSRACGVAPAGLLAPIHSASRAAASFFPIDRAAAIEFYRCVIRQMILFIIWNDHIYISPCLWAFR